MYKKIAEVLKATGNSEGIEKAKYLENESSQYYMLALRNLKLTPSDIMAIVTILEEEKGTDVITSISFSYNNLMGDSAAIALVKSLPLSIVEIGLVDCGISDKGGSEILQWMQTVTQLKMICMEQNNFSDELKLEFKTFKKNNPNILVVI